MTQPDTPTTTAPTGQKLPPSAPYEAALWVIGVAALIAGLALTAAAVDQVERPPLFGGLNLWPGQLAGPAFTLAVFSLVGALVLGGIRSLLPRR